MTDLRLTLSRVSLRKGLATLQAGALSTALALVGVSGLAASSAAAGQMQTAPAPAPVKVDLMLPSGLIAYDLVWSDHTDAARQKLADQAIGMLTDPAAPYILRIPQLTAAWRPLPADFSTSTAVAAPSDLRRKSVASNASNVLNDMFGKAIDLNKARLGRMNYERDLEKALIDVIDRIRAERPGALLTIDRFVPPQNYGAAANSYGKLIKELDFVTMQLPSTGASSNAKSNDKLSARAYSRAMSERPQTQDFDRAFAMAGAPANLFVLVEQNGAWMAVDDDPLPEVLAQNSGAPATEWGAPAAPTSPTPVNEAPTQNSGSVTNGGSSTPSAPPVVVEPDNDTATGGGQEEPVDQTPGSNDPPVDDDDQGVELPAPGDETPDTSAGGDDGSQAPQPPIDLPTDDPGDDDGPQIPQPPVDLPTDDQGGGDGGVTPPSDDDDNGASNPGGGGGHIPHNPNDGAGEEAEQEEEQPGEDFPEPPSDETPASPVDVLPLLVPGAGFNGPTPQPAPIGSGPGSDAKAIARWDVVPYQDFTGQFNVGVVAFHINGINRVEFSVEGGPWTPVYEMKHNPRTNVWEYFAVLNASDFEDGQVEVRAIAYPNAGIPRVLAGPIDMNLDEARVRGEHSMFLSANSGGGLATPVAWVAPNGNDETGTGAQGKPYRTIARAAERIQQAVGAADGATIYLKPGDYEYTQTNFALIPTTSQRWLTIAGSPNANPANVRIVSASGNGLRTKLLRLTNLTIYDCTLPAGGVASRNAIWLDGVIVEGTSPLTATPNIRGAMWSGGYYATGSTYHTMLRGPREATLVRDAYIYDIGGDAFREMNGIAINSHIKNLLNLDGTHNDVMQFYANAGADPFENIILYGLKAVDNVAGQSLFVRADAADFRDWAIVNYHTNATGGGGAQWQETIDHLLLWNIAIMNQGFVIRDNISGNSPTTITNLSVRDSIFHTFRLSLTGSTPNMNDQRWASNNHYIDGSSYQALAPGERATVGGDYQTLFMAPQQNDFRPRPGSVLTNRVTEPLAPVDVNLVPRSIPASIGALKGVD